ncbi:hypothetical protein [Actinomadura macrotermitis]|uniref:Uncharacterized protein n=1 Tax=Actinomadura macrotermitis TaxID=2585200 RepID=A0A7K0C3R5_9ACTN|nr:hypothetical protein [Actinomadura macrotermitis]MQY08016.1 hypothetical protein [Actinomadura macrotermitis]
MSIDLVAAEAFMATHARVLDRRRFELLMNPSSDPAAVLAALDGYRNPDGGYGWGLEADLRSPESQPGAALHAFEVFEEIAPATAPQAAALCDWLDSVALPDGGVPFALPLTITAGTAPWWQGADPKASALQITSVTAAAAWRVAAHDPAVAAHPWLERATRYCLAEIEAIDRAPHAYVLAFAIRFLDAVHDIRPEAAGLLRRLAEHLPSDGRLHVEGGTEEEALHPLDFAPAPGRPARELFDAGLVSADLDRLAAQQQEDGGWTVDYAKISPAGAMDWRGYITVRAVEILRGNGRL